MCINLYIGSNTKLPIIEWDDNDPQFYIREIDNSEVINIVSKVLKSKYLYEPGSYMGCSCGFTFYNSNKADEIRNSKRDLILLLKYLDDNLHNNEIKIINIDYNTLLNDFTQIQERYYNINLNISEMEEFAFDENVILIIVHK